MHRYIGDLHHHRHHHPGNQAGELPVLRINNAPGGYRPPGDSFVGICIAVHQGFKEPLP